MKKRLFSIIFLFLIITHVVIPINAAQAEQKSWFSSLFSSGVDLIKQHLVMAMFAALVYKA